MGAFFWKDLARRHSRWLGGVIVGMWLQHAFHDWIDSHVGLMSLITMLAIAAIVVGERHEYRNSARN